jgi:hypothetical protein
VSGVLSSQRQEGFAVVIPPGRGHRGDWQWWVTAVFFLVSVAAVIVGFALLVG